jgi:hypothetical protein
LKKKYLNPDLEISYFAEEDIISCSIIYPSVDKVDHNSGIGKNEEPEENLDME